MRILRLFSPTVAIRDFVAFARHRERHEIGFLFLAIAITLLIGWGFVHDSKFERPYERQIIYVENWPADRSDAEIIAQQKIDRERMLAVFEEERQRRAKARAEFKKLDDKLDSWGI